MTESLDYSICDLAQKYADMYPERPTGHLATHHSEYLECMICLNQCRVTIRCADLPRLGVQQTSKQCVSLIFITYLHIKTT